MDLLKLLCGFVQVVLRISWPLSNKTKLKFDQDFKVCWSFCFEPKVLNESKYSMPWVRCALSNVYIFLEGKRSGKHRNSYTQLFHSQGGSLLARTKMPTFCDYLQAQKPQTILNSWKHFCSRRLPPGISIKTNIKMTAYNGRPPPAHPSLEFVKSAKIIVFSCPTESYCHSSFCFQGKAKFEIKILLEKVLVWRKKTYCFTQLHRWGLTIGQIFARRWLFWRHKSLPPPSWVITQVAS